VTTLLASTVAAGLGGSGFIAAFTAGIVFGVVAADHAEGATFLSEQTGQLLNAVTFLLFGAMLLDPALGKLDRPIPRYTVDAVGLRPRPDRRAGRHPLCRLVPRPSRGGASAHAGESVPVAEQRPRAPVHSQRNR
jgi:hypothetical protein